MEKILKTLSHIMYDREYTPDIMQFSIGTIKPGYEYIDHSYLDAIEMIYVLDGAGYIGVNGQYMKVKSGECIVIFPSVIHNIYLNKKESCRLIDVIFKPGIKDFSLDNTNPENALSFFYELNAKRLNYFRFFDNIAFRSLLENINLLLKKNDDYSNAILKLDFCKMYLIFSEILDETNHTLEKSENRHVKQAQQYIFENYGNKINLEDISKTAGISSRQLSRLFYNEFGMNVQDYIIILRITKARDLLENSSMNITQIAYSLGFSSSDYFTSFFKKHESISPKAYRKRVH